jgi:hypothetical protein
MTCCKLGWQIIQDTRGSNISLLMTFSNGWSGDQTEGVNNVLVDKCNLLALFFDRQCKIIDRV